jgi:peptide-methionine (S)-S-oxide reductase
MQISYADLLNLFWESHSPVRESRSRQYMSIVFYHTEEQRELAMASRDALAARLGRTVYTELTPAKEFYLAEGYHQKYYLRQEPALAKEFEVMYPRLMDFVNSTAAARVNGFLGGNGTIAQLEVQIDGFGLSPEAERRLLHIVQSMSR